MSSCRAISKKTGFSGPEDYALIGTEDQVRPHIAEHEVAGVIDFGVQIGGENDPRTRTTAFVAALYADYAKNAHLRRGRI